MRLIIILTSDAWLVLYILIPMTLKLTVDVDTLAHGVLCSTLVRRTISDSSIHDCQTSVITLFGHRDAHVGHVN